MVSNHPPYFIKGGDTTPFDNGRLEQKWDSRGRPYPWDPSVSISAAANAVADTFGNYVTIFAAGTYDFGDTPNQIQVREISIENVTTTDTFILEISKYLNPTYTPLGAVRFTMSSPPTRSFLIQVRGREMNIDTHDLVARVKSGAGGGTVSFGVIILRHVSVSYHYDASPGPFPFNQRGIK
ncbi:MAG: hypothetical protein PHZ19_07745 [Candidatus Thermoplasmatota archaeon]|nr:hypothetical protein [Candidatus Thermoplasmatota archaeon]